MPTAAHRSASLVCSPAHALAARRRMPDRARRRRRSWASGRGAAPRPAPRTRWAGNAAAPASSSTSAGLVLTIGYLILEAPRLMSMRRTASACLPRSWATTRRPASGWCAPAVPLDAAPLRFGHSSEVADRRSAAGAQPRWLRSGAARRSSPAGASSPATWEYLLPDALFTTPPHSDFAGAALIDREGRLVGIGSLGVGDATRRGRRITWQHVRADRCPAADPGRPPGARPPRRAGRVPGSASRRSEHAGRLIVRSVADDGPADAAWGYARRRRRGGRRRAGGHRWPSSIAAMWQLGEPGCRGAAAVDAR